jgi:predicted nucleic acid-binding protein
MNHPERPFAIIDTNVLSYGIEAAPLAFTYARLLAAYDVRISFITSGECRYGVEKRRWSQRRRIELEILLEKYPVVPYSPGMDVVYARIMAEREHEGRPMNASDAWIAATAIYHDAPLATHDSDFLHTRGLKLIMAAQGELRALPRLSPGARAARPLDMNCRCGL